MEDFKERLSKTGLAEGTQKLYLGEAKKYLKDNDDLERFRKEDLMLAYIEAHYETLNQKNQMTKTVIKWRILNGLKNEYLSDYLTKNVAEYNASLTKKYETKDNSLPSLEEYNTFVNGLFDKKKYKDFIINKLIQMFQVRNLDLDLTITDKPKEVDTDHNWLVVKQNKVSATVSFVRNNYKTKKTYGSQEHEMKLKLTDPLYISIKNVLDSEKHKLLETTNIAREIQKATDGLGEGKVFKLLMKNATFKQAKKYGDNRGTDLETVSKYYDLK